LEGSVWRVYVDGEKLSLSERLSLNGGAKGVEEEKDGTILVYSDDFLDITDWASEYDFHFRDADVLLDRKNWEKYGREMPRLIAELEAAEGIANELNKKYYTNIKIGSGYGKWCFERGFDAKGMSEGEKLQEIERHARAMIKAWEREQKWVVTVGAEMAKKTERSRMRMVKFRKEVIARLQDITNQNIRGDARQSSFPEFFGP